MRGFWAVILFLLGLFLFYPGVFIWPFGIISMLMLAGAIVIALWEEESRGRPIVQIFAWMTGFVLLIEAAYTVFIRFFL